MGTSISKRLSVPLFLVVSLVFSLQASPASSGAALSAPPDENLNELLKVEEEALQYLEKKRDFYAMLQDESYILWCIPIDPDAPSEPRLPSGIKVIWTQEFGLAVWKTKEELRNTLAFLHRLRPKVEKPPVEEWVEYILKFSWAFKMDLKLTFMYELEKRINSKKAEIERLKVKIKEGTAAVKKPEAQYFLDRDFNVFVLDGWPETERKRFRTDRPTPSMMFSGTWLVGSKVNIVIAIEAYESDIVAQVMFDDRAKALGAGTGRERKARSERGAPTGHFKLDEAMEVCDSWLPEEGYDWIGGRARLRRYRNALITVTASYLDPVEEDRLADHMKKLEGRAMTIVDIALLRNSKGKAGEDLRPQTGREERP